MAGVGIKKGVGIDDSDDFIWKRAREVLVLSWQVCHVKKFFYPLSLLTVYELLLVLPKEVDKFELQFCQSEKSLNNTEVKKKPLMSLMIIYVRPSLNVFQTVLSRSDVGK